MMTFLVVANFVLNASLLDNQRLGKQRVESRQILNCIENGGGWSNHPIVHSWRPYVDALKYYTNCIIIEFIRRGGNNNLPLFEVPKTILMPWWVKWDRLHQSHRAMLMRKDKFYYHDKFTVDEEYSNYGYIWPNKALYKDRHMPLREITAPIPKELIDPIYCTGLLKSGRRSGQSCNRLVKDKYCYCMIHRKTYK